MIIVFDYQGIAHAVYNQRDIREIAERHNYVENWQIRTLCSPIESIDHLLWRSNIAQADLDLTDRGNAVTCLRCVVMPCDHGIYYDPYVARQLNASQVRSRFPRLDGECKRGCGYVGIHYASREHYYAGDW